MPKSIRKGAATRRLVFLCGLLPAVIAAVLPIYQPTSLSRLDRAVYDTVVRSMPPRPPSDQVVIVDVDERSLSTVGQWPWRRDVVAMLISHLRDMGASVVALDIIFAEPDRDAGDEALAAALRDGGVVLGYGMTFDAEASPHGRCVLHPVSLATFHSQPDTGEQPYFRATDAICSLPMLAESAGRSGFLNAAPDSDGILRRAPVVIELDGQVYPSLALAALAATTGTRDLALQVANVNSSSLIAGNRTIPLDGKGNLLLRYRGRKRTFAYVSAVDALNGALPEASVRGKIVLVGTTALGTREVVATPLDTLFAGVEVQATMVDNLLQHDFLRRPVYATTVESQASLMLGVAIVLLTGMVGVVVGVTAGATGAAIMWVSSVWLLSAKGAYVSPLFPTMSAVSVCTAVTFAKVAAERLRADGASRDKAIAQRLMVQTLLSLTQARDAETGEHSRRTQRYAKLLAEQLAVNPDFQYILTPERIELLSSLAPLHDIGKVGIPDHILNKPGPLTQDELIEMRKHPVIGREVIVKAEQQVGVLDDAILAMAKDIVYTHHEKWDGTGYPRGISRTDIPICGRIMAVVDVYDALVTRTLYQSKVAHDDAVAFIVGRKGAHFDPAVVDAFVSVAGEFRIVSGSSVRTADIQTEPADGTRARSSATS